MEETLHLLAKAEDLLKGAEESLVEFHRKIQIFPNTQEVVERVTAVEDQKRRISEEIHRAKCAVVELPTKVWPVLAGEERACVVAAGEYDTYFWFSAEGEILYLPKYVNRECIVWDREDFLSSRKFSRYVYFAFSLLERRAKEKAGSEVTDLLAEVAKMRQIVAYLDRLAELLHQ